MARMGAGDRGEPLEALVERYSGPLFGFGLRLLRDRGMAEEMVQDTFVRLWRGAKRYDPERGSVRTFVYTIARNAAIDLQRRAASRPLSTDAGDLGSAGAGDEPFDKLVLGLDVRSALQTLSDKHRQTLELAYDDDLTQRQIAERLGIPLGTVKTRSHHALRALRQELEVRGLV